MLLLASLFSVEVMLIIFKLSSLRLIPRRAAKSSSDLLLPVARGGEFSDMCQEYAAPRFCVSGMNFMCQTENPAVF
jgi:hypothetical protein